MAPLKGSEAEFSSGTIPLCGTLRSRFRLQPGQPQSRGSHPQGSCCTPAHLQLLLHPSGSHEGQQLPHVELPLRRVEKVDAKSSFEGPCRHWCLQDAAVPLSPQALGRLSARLRRKARPFPHSTFQLCLLLLKFPSDCLPSGQRETFPPLEGSSKLWPFCFGFPCSM